MKWSNLWGSVVGGVFLIGLGLLFYYDVLWPGILILLGIIAIMQGVGHAMWGKPKEEKSFGEDFATGGIITLCVGAGLFIGLYWFLGTGAWLIAPIIVLAAGIGLVLAYFFKK